MVKILSELSDTNYLMDAFKGGGHENCQHLHPLGQKLKVRVTDYERLFVISTLLMITLVP